MNLVQIEVKNAYPEVCPINKKNCVGCKYNISIGLLALTKPLYVLCGYKKEEES